MLVDNLEETTALIKPYLVQYLQEQGIDISKKFSCLYPDHEDSTPSSNIVGGNTLTPRFYCHGCGRSGDIFDAVKLIEKKTAAGTEWVEDTLKYLANKYGVEIKTKELTENEIYELDTYRAYKTAASLLRTDQSEYNPHFSRELTKREWHVGFLSSESVGTVKSFEEFYEALVNAGFSRKFLAEIDLNRKDIFNPDNMIFTWRDEKGRAIGFTARNLKYESEKAEAEKNGEKYNGKKYNNQRTTGLKVNIFQKGRRLYGIDKVAKDGSPIYIFEGQADVLTARSAGLTNCVAIAGSNLHEDHIALLRSLSIFDIVLCLDGDDTGQRKLAEILETKFAGKRDMQVRVIILPRPEDPDSFIRKNGLKAFGDLAHWTAFEWRLNQYKEEDDETQICHEMIPFIVNEVSPVVREKQCKQLAKRTGVSLKTIIEELNIHLDSKALVRSKERQSVLETAIYELHNNPDQAEMIFQKAQVNLLDLAKKHDSDTLSNEDFVRSLDEQKSNEEKLETKDTSLQLGEDLRELQEILRGDWEGCFICIGGKPNHGKTAFLSKFAYEIGKHNSDVVVIYHTIDDTAQQFIPRFVTIGEGSRKLSINMVRSPNYWENTAGISGTLERREKGYQLLRKLAQDGRLVVKDLNHGGSLAFIEHLIMYYREKFPERRLVYILDNFHKLRDLDHKDERVRYKALSQAMKDMSIRHHCTIIATVEYTKVGPGIKPTDYNIGETVQLTYDANAIIHLYSEVADIPEAFTVCHKGLDWKGQQKYLPRVEFMVTKNKISEQKGSFFLDFFPASSDYRFVDQQTVLEESAAMKQGRKHSILDKDPDEMTDGELNAYIDVAYS